jgi:hypothetical protein
LQSGEWVKALRHHAAFLPPFRRFAPTVLPPTYGRYPGMLTNFMDWVNGLGPAQQATLVAALIGGTVALSGSLMTFFRVFLERRSNKLVARDIRLREARSVALKPVAEAIDEWYRQMVMLRNAYSRLAREVGPEIAKKPIYHVDPESAEPVNRIIDALKSPMPIADWTPTLERFPLIRRSLEEIAWHSRHVDKIKHTPIKDADVWLLRNSDLPRRTYLSFNRSLEHLVFGVDNLWAWRRRMSGALRERRRERHRKAFPPVDLRY